MGIWPDCIISGGDERVTYSVWEGRREYLGRGGDRVPTC